jgi:hypothetical protein
VCERRRGGGAPRRAGARACPMSLSDPCAGERCASVPVCRRCVAVFSFGVADRGRPCRQRAADVRRYGVSSRCTPSVIGKSVCHVKTTVRRTPPSRGTLATWTGGQRGGIPAPRPDRAPPPKKGTRYTLNRFNRFESTPEDAPRRPIQSNNRTSTTP